MSEHRRYLILVPPGSEVHYAENPHIDEAAIMDRDELDRMSAEATEMFTVRYEMNHDLFGVPVHRAPRYEDGVT